MIANPNVINTGFSGLDSILTVLFSTSILVGGVLGCVLDNLIPGRMRRKNDVSNEEVYIGEQDEADNVVNLLESPIRSD